METLKTHLERIIVTCKDLNRRLATPDAGVIIAVLGQILSWPSRRPQTGPDGDLPRRRKTKPENTELPAEQAAAADSSGFPFTTSDLEYRDDALQQALDLRATVLRVK